ncbi:MAG: LysM peptidoglycan-binding domain-containing protein [Chloroflexi bacterium]|nr:LysM peptidoglycan-binding domain-containing protein [Chloroflexota bacterium]
MDSSSGCTIPSFFFLIIASMLTVLGFSVGFPADGSVPEPSPLVIVVTATAPGQSPVDATADATVSGGATPIATLDPGNLPAVNVTALPPTASLVVPTLTPQPSATPVMELNDQGCPVYTIQAGDTILAIANQYGVSGDDLMAFNGVTDPTRLQIGQQLALPLGDCVIPATPTPSPAATSGDTSPDAAADTTAAPPETLGTPFEIESFPPTPTLAPSQVPVQVIIGNVLAWSDVNTEGVEIRSLGNADINLNSWRLADEQGNEYVFPEYRLRPGNRVFVYTRQGSNTPAALYWGRADAAWSDGETATLTDSTGQVQATFVVGSPPVTGAP